MNQYYDNPNARAKTLAWNAAYTERRRAVILAFVREYLESHPCVDCGETRLACLEFDHVRGTKICSIGKMLANGKRLDIIQNEVAKCEVRCANCHRIKTHNQLGWKYAEKEQDTCVDTETALSTVS